MFCLCGHFLTFEPRHEKTNLLVSDMVRHKQAVHVQLEA